MERIVICTRETAVARYAAAEPCSSDAIAIPSLMFRCLPYGYAKSVTSWPSCSSRSRRDPLISHGCVPINHAKVDMRLSVGTNLKPFSIKLANLIPCHPCRRDRKLAVPPCNRVRVEVTRDDEESGGQTELLQDWRGHLKVSG